MKKYVKKILHALGFDLRRLKSSSEILTSPITKNITIELIGLSGVGKSTLFSDASKHLNYTWNINYPTDDQFRLKESNPLDEFYRVCLYHKALNTYEKDVNFPHYAGLLSFFSIRARNDRYLRLSGLLHEGGWILDESFCHNFISKINQIIENDIIDQDILKSFFEGRNFILFTASDDWLIRNLRNRQKNKPESLNNWLNVYGESGIIERARKNSERMNKFLEYATQYGSPSYEINLSDGYNLAIDSFLDIENQILKYNKLST